MRTSRRGGLAPFVILGAVAAGGLLTTSSAPARAASVTVEMVDTAFSPDTARVLMTEGEPSFPGLHAHVVFFNRDPVQHTATFDDPRVQSSPAIGQLGTYDAVFNDPGTFSYHCSIHPGMTGTVVVLAPVAPTTTSTTTQPPPTAAPPTVPSPTSTAPPVSTTTTRPPTSTSIVTTTRPVTVPGAPSAPPIESANSVVTTEPSTTTTTEPARTERSASTEQDGQKAAGRWPLLVLAVLVVLVVGGAVLWRRVFRAPDRAPPPRLPDPD